MKKTFLCVAVLAAIATSVGAEPRSVDEDWWDLMEWTRQSAVHRRTCFALKKYLMPLVYNLETYSRIAEREGVIPKAMPGVVDALVAQTPRIDEYRLSLGRSVDKLIGEMTTAYPLDPVPNWTFPYEGGCLKRELRSPVVKGVEDGREISTYQVYCVSELKKTEVLLYNGAVTLREMIHALKMSPYSTSARDQAVFVDELVKIAKTAETSVCSRAAY